MKIKLMESRVPKVFITNLAINKMTEYITGIDKEIGWLGTVTRDGLQFFIEDVFLFKQEVHSTTTEITPEGLNDFAMELMSTENGVEIWNNMKLWGHSHVNMGVNPSSQDDKQVETFESCGYDFFIRIICNKKGDVRLDLYDYETGIVYQELNYAILYTDEEIELKKAIEDKIASLHELLRVKLNLSEIDKANIKSEIKEKVNEKKYTYPKYGNTPTVHNYNGYNQTTWWDDYVTEDYPKKNANTSVINEDIDEVAMDAQLIFDLFSAPEVYEAFMHIESGCLIEEIMAQKTDRETAKEVEALIYDYVYSHYEDYKEYLFDTEVM